MYGISIHMTASVIFATNKAHTYRRESLMVKKAIIIGAVFFTAYCLGLAFVPAMTRHAFGIGGMGISWLMIVGLGTGYFVARKS